MKCIFCKKNSDASASVEHIVPESLGNQDHILPVGVVCDGCNHYFSIKIEKPLLESQYFTHVRHRNGIPSKKGRIPIVSALAMPARVKVMLSVDKEGNRSVAVHHESDQKTWIQSVMKQEKGSLYVLNPEKPSEECLVSRFLAKVAVEVFAHRLLSHQGDIDYVVSDVQLDPLREYARYGKGVDVWPYSCRRIYPEGNLVVDKRYSDEPYDVLHEFTLLYTETNELYLVMAIFGIEYAINYAGPELEGYEKWLSQHDGRSYLDMVEARS